MDRIVTTASAIVPLLSAAFIRRFGKYSGLVRERIQRLIDSLIKLRDWLIARLRELSKSASRLKAKAERILARLDQTIRELKQALEQTADEIDELINGPQPKPAFEGGPSFSDTCPHPDKGCENVYSSGQAGGGPSSSSGGGSGSSGSGDGRSTGSSNGPDSANTPNRRNSAGSPIIREFVKDQDELLAAAEKAAGGSLKDWKTQKGKGSWFESPDGKTRIEWEPAGHANTNEGPHVTIRVFDGQRHCVTRKIFIEGWERFKRDFGGNR